STNQIVATVSVPYDESANGNGPIVPGDGRDRSAVVVWPTGTNASGRFEFQVSTDRAGDLFEFNPGGTGETNNLATVTVLSAPDLQVANLRVTPQQPQSGTSLTIAWDDLNAGTATPA